MRAIVRRRVGWPWSSRSNAASPACTARTGWNAVHARPARCDHDAHGQRPQRRHALAEPRQRLACGHGGRGGGPRRVLEPRAQRPAAGHPAGAQQRDAALAGTNHVQSIERVDAEHDDDRDQREQADALGVERQAAVAPPQAGRARAAPATPRAASSDRREARPAEVGERLHHVAVRVADRQRVVAEAGARTSRRRRRPRRATARARGCRTPRASSARAPTTSRSGGPACWPASRVGSVSWFHAFETWPSTPPGAAARAISAEDRARARARRARRGRRAALARRRRALGGREADRQPGDEQHGGHQQQQRAELVAGVDARGDRRRRRSSAVLRERPRDHGGRRRRARGGERDRAAQPQRHEREPERDADQRASAPRE